MASAVLFPIPHKTAPGYCWRWRSVDGAAESDGHFMLYYDCLVDAKTHGYSIEPSAARIGSAPRSKSAESLK